MRTWAVSVGVGWTGAAAWRSPLAAQHALQLHAFNAMQLHLVRNIMYVCVWWVYCSHRIRIRQKGKAKGKGRRCWLRDGLKCRTSHLASRMIWRTVFGRTSILVGGGLAYGMNRRSSIFSRHPLRQADVILLIFFFKSSWYKISCSKDFRPPISSNDLCLLFWIYPSSREIT